MSKKKAISIANKEKVLKGLEWKETVDQRLEMLKKEGFIKEFKADQNFREEGFKYENQYLANFVIETLEGNYIIVNGSNSFENGRAKNSFYDLEGIARNADFKDKIVATVFLVNDNQKKKNFTGIQKQFNEKAYYAPISHMLTLSQFVNFLEVYAGTMLAAIKEEEGGVLEIESAETIQGRHFSLLGLDFESQVVDSLNDPNTLIDFISGMDKSKLSHLILDKLICHFDIKKDSIDKIKATNAIPLLASLGNPKTDVSLSIFVDSYEELIVNFSIKRTTQTQVSCHEYSVEKFIEILDCYNTPLANYLTLFCDQGGSKKFEENFTRDMSVAQFEELLAEKKKILNEWALMGKHDNDNLTEPKLQVAEFILIQKGEKIMFERIEDYISKLEVNNKGRYGVPFGWTIPSGGLGKRIQLKVPVLVE